MLYHLFHYLLAGRHYAYENPLFRGVLAAMFCFIAILIVGPWVIRQLVRLKLGDHPEFDHATLNELMREKSRIPTMGGVMILAAILAGILLFADILNFYVQMGILCLLWLCGVGAVDDWFKLTQKRSGSRHGLKSYEKLLFQIGLGVVLGYFVYSTGGPPSQGPIREPTAEAVGHPSEPTFEAVGHPTDASRVLSVPFYKPGVLLGPLVFMAIAVLVISFTSNAVNFTDGMDGLASGCVAISSLVFMILAFVAGDAGLAGKLLIPHVPRSAELSVICGSVMGACMGFLWYNCHPARVFMGDTGSLPLGGVIGFVAIVIRQELMLLIVGGVFVIEVASVILQVGYFKATGGKRILRCSPIHHHFHLSGWTETQTVTRFWLAAAMFAIFALATVKLR